MGYPVADFIGYDGWTALLSVICFITAWNIFNYFYNHILFKWRVPNLTKEDIDVIDKMASDEFEDLLHKIFMSKGYNISIPRRKGQQNYFIITKEGVSTAVRFYKFSTRQRITPNSVYHVLTGKVYNQCNQALLITTTRFTAETEAKALKEGVLLWDRTRLFHEVSRYIGRLKEYEVKPVRY